MSDEVPLHGAAQTAHADAPRAAVFMCDPSAEAERVTQLLHAAGYVVADVPLSMLLARVAVQRPAVIVIDADATETREVVTAIRAMEDGGAVELVLLGEQAPGGASRDTGFAGESHGFFARPFDPTRVVRKIDEMTNRAILRASSRPPPMERESTPPSVMSPSSRVPGSNGARWLDRRSPVPPTGAPLSARPPSSVNAVRETSLGGGPVIGVHATLSAELEALLVEAEQRAGPQGAVEVPPLTPEEELATVLPPELLAALDEPIEEEEDDVALEGSLERSEPPPPRGAGTSHVDTNAGRDLTPAAPELVGPHTMTGAAYAAQAALWSRADTDDAVDPRAHTVAEPLVPAEAPTPLGAAPTLSASAVARVTAAISLASGDVRSTEQPRVAATVDAPATPLEPGDTPRLLAGAVSSRATGTLSFEADGANRHVVLRDGDIVTAASTADDETLLEFLMGRGDLRREQVRDLVGKVAPFGRHAGAALVAHGLLRQDQLWTALRAHAEWVLARALQTSRGVARILAEPPGRLRQEPSVFGGSSGSEVFVEVARRALAPEESVLRLGGASARVTEGSATALLLECALGADDRTLIEETRGSTVREILSRARGPGVAPMLYALSLLGVVAVVPDLAASARPSAPSPSEAGKVDEDAVLALDVTAVRERIRARYELVCEADYFTLLGVSRDATGYEVRQAFVELRRAFEPSRLLTPELVDMEADVRTIVLVLDEAYEILRDGARRERYRRALGD